MAKKYDSLIFDLDGTFWNTTDAVRLAWTSLAQKYQCSVREVTYAMVASVTGKSLADCIHSIFAAETKAKRDAMASEAGECDNAAVRKWGGVLYPGVRNGIVRLREHYPLFICSNCQAGYIEIFLEQEQLTDSFVDWECWGNTLQPKASNIAQLVERNSLQQPVYVGDTLSDLEAAQACGIDFLHVTYGFGPIPRYRPAFASFAELVEGVLKD